MGRRSVFKEAALRAVLSNQTQFICFGKSCNINAHLTPQQIKNPQASLDEIEKEKQKTKIIKQADPVKPSAQPIPLKNTGWNGDRDPCFVIANGESRRNFDLSLLKHRGYIIGMNVLPIVEDFWPDALISVDIATVKYICERNVPDKLEMWSYPRGGIKDSRVVRIDKDWGWSSGPTATRIALEKKGFKTIYILGMDFFGLTKTGEINEKAGVKINNMYKGTDRYRKSNADRTYFGNWLNQMVQNVTNNPQAKFYHVVLPNQTSPSRLLEKSNWIDITYDQFGEHLKKIAKKEP